MISQSVTDLLVDEKPVVTHRMIVSLSQYFDESFPIELNQNICEIAVAMINKDLDIESVLFILEKDFSNPEYEEYVSIDHDNNPDSDKFVNYIYNLSDNIAADISPQINNTATLFINHFLSDHVAEVCVCYTGTGYV